jgi:hypothetical protein
MALSVKASSQNIDYGSVLASIAYFVEYMTQSRLQATLRVLAPFHDQHVLMQSYAPRVLLQPRRDPCRKIGL